jgi:hypothetical protein
MPETTQESINRLGEAMFSPAFPSNPLPFLDKLSLGVRENGTDWIKSDEAKRLLWTVNAIAYGQLSTINLFEEWKRLKK